MNTNLSLLENIDPEINDRIVSRRNALRQSGTIGAGLMLASIPATFAFLARKAFAGSLPTTVTDVLNFALKLEYLESEFYTRAVGAAGLIPSSVMPVFAQIQKHEAEHVNYLKSALGSSAVAKPTFDFTAKGAFPDPFQAANYQVFLALSQAFEDTGVRAYKGQAGNLISDKATLTVALQIHSVEARHAAMVRRIRGQQGWITGNQIDSGIPAAAAPVYAGEEVTTQLNVNIAGFSGISSDAASEAFDEPLTMDQVLAIAGLFIV